MARYYYPTIFIPDDEVGGFSVIVPDLNGCFSEGDNLTDAMKMAQEAIACHLSDVNEKDYPKPSKVSEIDTSKYENAIINIIEFDPNKFDENYKPNETVNEILLGV